MLRIWVRTGAVYVVCDSDEENVSRSLQLRRRCFQVSQAFPFCNRAPRMLVIFRHFPKPQQHIPIDFPKSCQILHWGFPRVCLIVLRSLETFFPNRIPLLGIPSSDANSPPRESRAASKSIHFCEWMLLAMLLSGCHHFHPNLRCELNSHFASCVECPSIYFYCFCMLPATSLEIKLDVTGLPTRLSCFLLSVTSQRCHSSKSTYRRLFWI